MIVGEITTSLGVCAAAATPGWTVATASAILTHWLAPSVGGREEELTAVVGSRQGPGKTREKVLRCVSAVW